MLFRNLFFLIFPVIGVNSLISQTTPIPDPNFESALIFLGYDSGSLNGFVPTANIDTITVLDINNMGISDITGIEDFTALEVIICDNNSITSLDFSQNLNLTGIRAQSNQINNINVTQNQMLNLLWCGSNQITSLNLTQNTALGMLWCNDNQLTDLNVSLNTNLFNLRAYNNLLTCLNVKNTNNSNFSTFNVTNNPNLICIDVDDDNWANANWGSGKDSWATFSTNCGNSCSTVGIEEQNEISFNTYPNPSLGNFTIDLGDVVTDVNATLTNSLGQVVFTKNYTSTNLIELEIEGSAGLYFLQLETDNNSQVIKILKE